MEIRVPWGDEPPTQLTSLEEIRTWTDDELKFWRRFQTIFTQQPLYAVFDWSRVENGFQQLASAAQQGGFTNEQIQGAANNITGNVSFSTRHPVARLMDQLIAAKEDLQTVAMVYTLYRNPEAVRQSFNYPNLLPDAFKAAYHLTAFRQLRHDAAPAAFIEHFKAYENETSGALKKAQNEGRDAEQRLGDWRKRAEDALQKQSSEFGEKLTRFEGDLANTKKLLSEQLALQAPMSYWSTKANDHLNNADGYRNWFWLLLFIGVVGFGFLAYFWLLPQLDREPKIIWPVVLFSALFALWAWPARLMAKFYLSQRHLFEDASERAVIAKTFLALREAKVDLTNDDRKLLLAALFRDSTAGLVKDDHPVNVMDAFASIFRGKG